MRSSIVRDSLEYVMAEANGDVDLNGLSHLRGVRKLQGTALMTAETIPTVRVHDLRLIKTCALSPLQDRRRVTMARARPDPKPGYTGSFVRLIRVCISRLSREVVIASSVE